jgi:hypothetical protein
MQILTIKDVINKAPAIKHPSVQGKYISTKDILSGILGKGWVLKDAIQQGNSDFTQHCAVIAHETTMRDDVALQQGYPQIYIWNTKRDINYLIGWHNPLNNTDFITPKNFIQDSVFKHNNNKLSIDELVKKLDYSRVYFESMDSTMNEAKNRRMSDMELLAFANYATDIRYRKKKKPYSFNSFSLLNSPNANTFDKDLWTVSNIIFGNIINGSKNGGNGIKSFKERLTYSWKFWQGFSACTIFEEDDLFHSLIEVANNV